MVEYQKILHQYLISLKQFHSLNNAVGMATVELSFRPYLDAFFSSLCAFLNPSIQRIFEPVNQDIYGRPDWVFIDSDSMGIYGYVEAKGFSSQLNINESKYIKQVSRYLNLGNPVLLTDGVEFIYYHTNGKTESFALFEKPIDWTSPRLNLQSLEYFQKFFSSIGSRTCSEQMIISDLSARAKLLCADLCELLNLEEHETESESELATVRTLKRLWDNAASNLDNSLSNDRTFAGFISQILAFGLLYAHRYINDEDITPAKKYDKLHYFWTKKPYRKYSKHVEPFVHLFNALSEELDSKLSKIGGWYDNTRHFLAFVKLSKAAKERPNFHQLYEAFLSSYDKSTRIDFGAWYTPPKLADYMTRLVYHNIQINPSLRRLQGNSFYVIDPCCGTGTFLEFVLSNIPLPKQSELVGFEILPVPYALANYRLSHCQIPDNIDLSVHLTNTLGDNTFVKPEFDLCKLDEVGLFFAKEQVASYRYSQPPLTIIIGNPPCSDSSVTNAGQILEGLMEDFRPPVRRSRQNVQMQLSNEWIKFLRWGIFKAVISRPSIIAFLLPSAFAENVSFKYARKYLVEKANDITVIEFDSDNRIDGESQNIFNTRQGRLLLLASFTSDTGPCFVRYKDLRSIERAEKLRFFTQPVSTIDGEVLALDKDYSFRPKEGYEFELYSSFMPLYGLDDVDNGIFIRHCSGMKLAPTHLLVHFSKGQLSRRNKYIGDESIPYDEIKERWYSGQAKPPAEKKLTTLIRRLVGASHSNCRPYSYRPFLDAYVNDDENLLSALKNVEGGGMRYRPEVRAAFSDPDVFGFALAPAPAEISKEIDKFCSFCWHLPDNDLSTRGNAHVFCNKFPSYKKGRTWNPRPYSNVNKMLLDELNVITGYPISALQDKVVFYVYAVLSAPYFLNRFSVKLHSLAGQIPAVPITRNKELFDALAYLGERLAQLERSNYEFSKEERDSEYFLSWNNLCEQFELRKYSVSEREIELFTSTGEVINIPISKNILSFSVSGYNIVKEWLKYHSYAYYRKKIGKEEILDFMNLLNRIRLYTEEYQHLNTNLQKILESSLLDSNKLLNPANG